MTRLTPRHPSTRRRPRRGAWPLVLAVTLFAGAAGAREIAAPGDPSAVVRAMSRELVAAAAPLDAAERVQAMERAAAQHADFEHMARQVLARHWGAASPEQRQRFVDAFRTWLIRTFSGQIASVTEGEMTLSPAQIDPTGTLATVRARVKPAVGPAVLLDYRLRRSGGPWKLVDISMGGISLVSTYGGSFRAQARSLGMNALIERMVARNRHLQAG